MTTVKRPCDRGLILRFYLQANVTEFGRASTRRRALKKSLAAVTWHIRAQGVKGVRMHYVPPSIAANCQFLTSTTLSVAGTNCVARHATLTEASP